MQFLLDSDFPRRLLVIWRWHREACALCVLFWVTVVVSHACVRSMRAARVAPRQTSHKHTRLRHMLDSSIGGAQTNRYDTVSYVDIYDYRWFAGVKWIPYRSLTERAIGNMQSVSSRYELQLSLLLRVCDVVRNAADPDPVKVMRVYRNATQLSFF